MKKDEKQPPAAAPIAGAIGLWAITGRHHLCGEAVFSGELEDRITYPANLPLHRHGRKGDPMAQVTLGVDAWVFDVQTTIGQSGSLIASPVDLEGAGVAGWALLGKNAPSTGTREAMALAEVGKRDAAAWAAIANRLVPKDSPAPAGLRGCHFLLIYALSEQGGLPVLLGELDWVWLTGLLAAFGQLLGTMTGPHAQALLRQVSEVAIATLDKQARLPRTEGPRGATTWW